ncbi:hypothetical protein [Mycolicibacterium vaccae]|uniref:hypothetical protein n=1 Tax=Mycolicibacterium vaccae TaxID=1810 RepID=UPI003D063BB9
MTSQQPHIERVDTDRALLACCTLTRIDHADAHLLRADQMPARTPQAWAREILESAPVATRLRLRTGWRSLSLRLHHGEPDTVAGWPITADNDEYVRLHADSWIGLTGELVTRVGDDGVTFATFVRVANPVARLVWAKVLPHHLAVVRSLVEGAGRRAGDVSGRPPSGG